MLNNSILSLSALLVVTLVTSCKDSAVLHYHPIEEENCATLAQQLSKVLGVSTTKTITPFEDFVQNNTGKGCQITASGDGRHFKDLPTVIKATISYLRTQGMRHSAQFQADSPNSTASYFENNQQLCLLIVSSNPADTALCSQEEPFAACWTQLAPEQQNYTVILNCAKA